MQNNADFRGRGKEEGSRRYILVAHQRKLSTVIGEGCLGNIREGTVVDSAKARHHLWSYLRNQVWVPNSV